MFPKVYSTPVQVIKKKVVYFANFSLCKVLKWL